MSEIEVPIEQAQEHINEHAAHAREEWISQVALYSALLAAIAAVSALLAGHHVDEALITQIRASNQWSYYQAKSVKSSVLQSKMQLLTEMGKSVAPGDAEKVEQYKNDQDEISEKARHYEEESEHHLHAHSWLAKAVTFFQVAIAVSAIAVLSRRKPYWFVSMGFTLIGLIFFVLGLKG